MVRILLDIDGVMLPANAWRVPEILLTSSHKSRFSRREWQGIFSLRGIAANEISVLPEATERVSRLDEIVAWYKTHVDEAPFVIIDDDKGLNALPSFLKSRLVLTSGSVGLTEELAVDAIQLLLSEARTAVT